MSGNGWTPERRQQQRDAIQRWKPWERSTGPKTDDGKRRSAKNSTVTGIHSAENRAIVREIREQLRAAQELLNRF